jgi:hypothetical protein
MDGTVLREEDHPIPREKRSDLGNLLGEVVYECEKRGLQMPFIIVGVGINGSVMVLGHSLDDEADAWSRELSPSRAGRRLRSDPFIFPLYGQNGVAVK